jgi:glycosyltransferase involved in cell wall biosynthesis
VNVLFLLPDFVFPADRGLRVRSLSQLRVLASIDAVENITVLSLAEKQVSVDRIRGLESAIAKVRAVPPVIQPVHMRRSPKHMPRLLRLRARGVPYLVAKCDAPLMRALVEHHLTAAHYDLVYVGAIGMAGYLRSVRRLAPEALVVLEEHNVEWEIFERLAPTYRFPMRAVAHHEAQTLRSYEARTLRAVDAVIAISDADARALEKLSGVAPIVVPTYVERGAPRTETTDAPALAYTGLLAWQPNAQGLDWFCANVWPLVRERVPAATLKIAGPGLRKGPDGALAVPPAWVAPGITTVGYVDDLEDLYKTSVAMVAPIVGGSGVRMKLLESMRAGMPTVTTTDGAAGLDVEDGREMLIADGPAEFADRVARMLTDRGLRERVRSAGYGYLESHHSLAAARARLEAAFSAGRVASARRGH